LASFLLEELMKTLEFRLAKKEDEGRLQEIRAAAFAPIFASFRELLGEEIYELAQRRDDEAQGALLTSLLSGESGAVVYSVESEGVIVGFMAILLHPEKQMGEVGLNAVDPTYAGEGIGTSMYEFAVEYMRNAGMKVATVSTGGDDSHAPARRAYQKAGFTAVIPAVWMCRKI
jgi:GNAT superfamily N-acetyltransferase